MKIAFIDTLGLPYDGSTVSKRGLGGSESAVTYLSAELARIGMEVSVFCHCNFDDAKPGVYQGVTYEPLEEIRNRSDFDVVIASRSVEAWLPSLQRPLVKSKLDLTIFDSVQKSSCRKILWLHDTFCFGDQLVEDLVVQSHIHELFVLSDWHLSYVLNCDHGKRRNYEVLKARTWITRNGACNYQDWIDPSDKDPNQFVYNSSVSKGMTPLLERIWPQISSQVPQAKLKVIGGYYRFRSDDPPDEQEQKWHKLYAEHHGKRGVEFTGIITQKEIAEILAKSSLMLYPSSFPETFGISALESLNALTPLVTNRFGALEEVAIDLACYKLDYAIEPNGLFPGINMDQQVDRFVDLALRAHGNKYLLQQKQNYCRIVQPLIGWDQVALQWKQHFYKASARYLSAVEFERTTLHQLRWQQVFGRRHTNLEQHVDSPQCPEQQIVVVTPFYNAQEYIEQCIDSVASQCYGNYVHMLVDDASTDASYRVARDKIASLPSTLQAKFQLLQNSVNQGAVHNQWDLLTQAKDTCPDNSIVMLLDGDDCLVNRNDIFSFYNRLFDNSTQFTYGSCWSMADSIPLVAQEYPPSVKQNREYRKHHFNWLLPYTHLRAFRLELFNQVQEKEWQNDKGEWFRAGGDTSVFYSLIERADPQAVKAVQDIVVNYNDQNPLNDYKVNGEEQNYTARRVLGLETASQTASHTLAVQKPQLPSPVYHKTKKIIIGIPTAKYIEVDTFKSVYDQIRPKNCEVNFQYFWGYNVEQVRNIMVNWSLQNGFDYLLSMDSDIIAPANTLDRLLEIQTDIKAISSGVYIQRKEDQRIPEIYVTNPVTGGHMNIDINAVQESRLIDVEAVGFGCCLVRRDVFEKVGNPWFVYHSNTDFSKILSEDVDFCMKAKAQGYEIVVDTALKLGHIHKTVLQVDSSK